MWTQPLSPSTPPPVHPPRLISVATRTRNAHRPRATRTPLTVSMRTALRSELLWQTGLVNDLPGYINILIAYIMIFSACPPVWNSLDWQRYDFLCFLFFAPASESLVRHLAGQWLSPHPFSESISNSMNWWLMKLIVRISLIEHFRFDFVYMRKHLLWRTGFYSYLFLIFLFMCHFLVVFPLPLLYISFASFTSSQSVFLFAIFARQGFSRKMETEWGICIGLNTSILR